MCVCVCVCVLYSHNHNIDLRTSKNEQTLLYKNLSHTLYSRKGWCFCGVWEMVETGTDCYIDPASSLDHSTFVYLLEPTLHFFRILAGVAQPGVTESQNPQSARWPSVWSSQPIDSTAAGICLYSFVTPTCFRFFFRLFTQMHLWLMDIHIFVRI